MEIITDAQNRVCVVTDDRDEFGRDYKTERVISLEKAIELKRQLSAAIDAAVKADIIERTRLLDEDAASFLENSQRFDVEFIRSCTTLSQAFEWSSTPQGHQFWDNLDARLRRNEL